MAVLGPKRIIFIKNFSLASLGINSQLLIISIFSRLATLTIVLCIYAHIYIYALHFIFIGSYKLYIIKCTFIMNIAL